MVDGLLGDAKAAGDLLPGPAVGAGVVDLERLQDLQQAAQGRDRSEADLGVLTVGCRRQGRYLTIPGSMSSRYLDAVGAVNPS